MGVCMRTSRLWLAIACAATLSVAVLAVPLSAAISEANADAAAQPSFALGKDTRTADETFAAVSQLARELSTRPYAPAAKKLPDAFSNLDYDSYRKLRPRAEVAIWHDQDLGHEFLPLPRGGLFRYPVQLHVVDGEGITRIVDAAPYVDASDFPEATSEQLATLGFSGWRLLKPDSTLPDASSGLPSDEFAVFQGGSYFRAISDGLVYGLSARALAIGTASPNGEEFPDFTSFWIVKPENDDAEWIEAIGLLDSESVSGAVRFKITAGAQTVFDVTADYYPRKEISEVGLAPMSSMFFHGSADPGDRIADYRPEVHDSDGLLIRAKSGEHVWRPVTNPRQLEVSTFELGEVSGFGLMQRRREFGAYADLEASYESRPGLWIEPLSGWADGKVVLVEIPTRDEYNDNIVALWRPAAPWTAGAKYSVSYRLHWSEAAPGGDKAAVASTRVAAAPGNPDLRRFVIDYTGDVGAEAGGDPLLDVWSSAGEIRNLHTTYAPSKNLRRIVFDLDPQGKDLIELHAAFRSGDQQTSETWLYRWTPE